MQTVTFNHIALAVKDVDESVSFYQNVFHFEEIENTASDSKTRWLSLGEGKELHLIPRNAEIKTVMAVHFALTTSHIDLFVEHLVSLKIKYFDWLGTPDKIHVRNDGVRQIYFQDPNGYWIEVNNALLI